MSVCPITMKKENLDYDGPRRDAREAHNSLKVPRRLDVARRRHGLIAVVVVLVVVVI